MGEQNNERAMAAKFATGTLKSWVMVMLTLVFVALYASALVGWLRPLADDTAIARLEPIIFVIIGYYFGRLPAQQNEQVLKVEVDRQTQKADAAQHAKEQILQEREVLEEKIKNAKVVLASKPFKISPGVAGGNKTPYPGDKNQFDYDSVEAAVSILSS